MEETANQPKKFNLLLIIFALVALFTAGFVGTYYVMSISSKAKATPKPSSKYFTDNRETEITTSTPKGTPTNTDTIYSVLLLGYGGAGHSGGTLSDSIIQLVVNKTQKKNIVITIPRDLWVTIPTDFSNESWNKINAAYAIGLDDTKYPNKRPEFKASNNGGGNLSKYMVAKVTGYPIDNFISIDFSNLQKAVDLLGGIEVDVPKSFTDEYYPIKGKENETCGLSAETLADINKRLSGFELEKQYTCRYEKITFNKGKTKMDGATVLKFVRSRHSNDDGGDFARSQRQIAVILAMKNKILDLDLINKRDPLLDTLADSVTTDINLTTLGSFAKENSEALSYPLVKINLSTTNILKDSKSSAGAYILESKTGSLSGITDYIRQEVAK